VFLSFVVQHDQAPRLNRIQATSTRGVRARIRRVAGCATPTGSAGHAGATANLKLTFYLAHSAGLITPAGAGTGAPDPVGRSEISEIFRGGRFLFLPVFFPLDFKRDKSLMLFNNIA
jgi:hypothetical protein